MPTVSINILSLLIAVIVSNVLGMLWYGPIFGKQWMKLMKFSDADIKKAKECGMGKSMLLMILASILMAFVLSHAIAYASAFYELSGPFAGAMGGFWNWLGFVVPVTLSSVIWEGKPWKLWVLNNGYYLASLVLMGMIIASM